MCLEEYTCPNAWLSDLKFSPSPNGAAWSLNLCVEICLFPLRLLQSSSCFIMFIFILLFFKGVGDFVFERWLGEGLQFVRNIFKFCDWKQVKNTSGACLLVPSTTCCISSIVRKAKYYLLDLNHGKHGKKSPSYISSNSMGSKVRNIPENFAYHNCLKFYVILFLITSMFA